jgi:hypothetical protein
MPEQRQKPREAAEKMKSPAPRVESDLMHLSLVFLQAKGHSEILSLSASQIKEVLKSDELYQEIHHPEGLPDEQRESLRKNLSVLGKNKKFFKAFCEAYGDADAMSLRWLFGEIYHSSLGKALMEDLTGLSNSTRFPALLKGIFKVISTNLTVSEDEMAQSFEHFKYPEKVIPLGNREIQGAELLRKAIEGSEAEFPKASASFARFCIHDPSYAANIFKSQEIRGYLRGMMADREKRQNITKLLNSGTGRTVLSKALDTPEGINLLGYLFNTREIKDFFYEMVFTQNPIETFKTVKMIMGKQETYAKRVLKLEP